LCQRWLRHWPSSYPRPDVPGLAVYARKKGGRLAGSEAPITRARICARGVIRPLSASLLRSRPSPLECGRRGRRPCSRSGCHPCSYSPGAKTCGRTSHGSCNVSVVGRSLCANGAPRDSLMHVATTALYGIHARQALTPYLRFVFPLGVRSSERNPGLGAGNRCGPAGRGAGMAHRARVSRVGRSGGRGVVRPSLAPIERPHCSYALSTALLGASTQEAEESGSYTESGDSNCGNDGHGNERGW
jgi:hypothetical protein